MSTPEAITPGELRASIDRLGWYLQRPDGEPATHPADRIIRDVERNRGPVYAVGDLFEDAEGKQWYRVGGDLPWRHVPTSQHHGEDRPKRPLRKLVPEGSPLADSERDLIRADLGKLLDLLGLGDFARPASSHEVFVMCLEEVAKRLEAVTKFLSDREEACPGGC